MKNSNIDDQTKNNINWYPGHMAKTKKQILEDLKLVDIVIEILDARIPKASKNPDLQEWIKNKKRIVVLNKCDLAEESKNKEWVEYYKKRDIEALLVNANSGEGIKQTIRKIEEIAKEDKKTFEEKGRVGKSIRIMIVGIPNVGKSSFINRIVNKASTVVGNKPGVTKQKQWVRLKEKIELLDTPGILWPKLEPKETALNLAYTGSIKEDNLERVEIAFYLLKYLLKEKRQNLINRYSISNEEIEEILNNKENLENENIVEIMHKIGKKRGAILSGGIINEEKCANILLEDFRTRKIRKNYIRKTI